MSIEDPGGGFPYLVVKAGGKDLLVQKSCRALRFDAYWETEPVPEDFKPDMTLLTNEVPTELWEIMNESERLRCQLADARSEIRQLKKRNANFLGALIIVAGIGWTFMTLHFGKQ
jgi:hypothetical protein